MRLAGLHHITMITGDAHRTVGFYVDVLGLRLVKKTINFDDPYAYHLYFGDESGTPGSILTWFEYAGARRLAANGAAVALVARRRERLDEIASAIGSDGGTVLVHARGGTTLRMKFASMWDGVAKSPHNATGRLLGSWSCGIVQAREGRNRPPRVCSSHPDA